MPLSPSFCTNKCQGLMPGPGNTCPDPQLAVGHDDEAKMCERCQKIIEKIWPKLKIGKQYRRTDLHRRKDFTIKEITILNIKIIPQNISITKESFLTEMRYLIQIEHNFKNHCLNGHLEISRSISCCFLLPLLSQSF